ncbi:uncharacterized protein N7459_010127 [Penicillium hispanicum]|uniref:uncharacterized protein n=1 Tax=Penicillium hispanicum TaxID=1080232 RepID=UPI00254086AC|nr:uncharacterized protein N7459_010127 [Penicillium hispanicum]KAJ5566745.1 hypothetical protein N7459_010127 [Penicillium hispanicum]
MYLDRAWTAVVATAVLAVAAPSRPVRRDVSSDVLSDLTLYAQYSAAAYCTTNFNSTGTALSCSTDNCPEVQSADTLTLYEFDEYVYQPPIFSHIRKKLTVSRTTDFGDVTGFFAADSTNNLLVLSFRGSSTISNWIADLDFIRTDVSDLCSGCEAHSGFWKSWETVADKMTSEVQAGIKSYPNHKLVVTGHSLGAALAVLGGTALRKAGYELDIYTYGEPRVGNKALVTHITNQGSLWRVTHTDDIVPKLPPASFGFSQPSPEFWITSGNDETVTTSDIQVIEGIDSTDGNAGTLLDSVSAHKWYIIDIDECD